MKGKDGSKMKKKDMDSYLTEKARSCWEVCFPKLYFEKIFFPDFNQFFVRNNIDEVIENYEKAVVEEFTDKFCPRYLWVLKNIDERYENNSIFFSTSTDMENLFTQNTPVEAEEKINNDIIDLILFAGYARDMIDSFQYFTKIVFKFCECNRKTWMNISEDPPKDEVGRANYESAMSSVNKELFYEYNK